MIETERLSIRPLAEEEREALAALWLDPANARLHPADTAEQVRTWVQGAWGVWEREGGELVGDCTLFFAEEHGEWELAYGFRRDRWGRGYATEAAAACVRYGFDVLGVEKLVADVDRVNAASIRVLEKCGFECVDEEPEKLLYAALRA